MDLPKPPSLPHISVYGCLLWDSSALTRSQRLLWLETKSFYAHLTLFIYCKPDSSLLIQGQPFFVLLGNMCIDFYLILLLLRVKLVDKYQTHIRNVIIKL